MESIVLAFVSFFGWGIGDIFTTIASRKLGVYFAGSLNLIAGFLIFGLLIPFNYNDLFKFSVETFLLTGFLSVIFIIGMYAYFRALEKGNSSLVGTIVASFSALSTILSILFLGNSITEYQLMAIIIIFFGIIVSLLNPSDLFRRKMILNKNILLALLAFFCFGFYYAFIEIPVSKVGWFWPNYYYYCLFPLSLKVFRRRKINLKNLKIGTLAVIGTTIITGIAEFSYNIAIGNQQVSIVAPIAGSYPVLFVLLTFLVFRDRLTKQQLSGIIVTLGGIIWLSFISK